VPPSARTICAIEIPPAWDEVSGLTPGQRDAIGQKVDLGNAGCIASLTGKLRGTLAVADAFNDAIDAASGK
jgi:hypothetical protein